MIDRSRKGEAIDTTDDATIITVTAASDHRCGVNSRPIRRRDTCRAWAFSCAVLRRPARAAWGWASATGGCSSPSDAEVTSW
jgi:hypothetical protein